MSDVGRSYLGCSVFDLAASWARAAIQASYSGVPRRGGTPAGSPPIQCGISAIRSPAVWPAQDDRRTHVKQSNADLSAGKGRFMAAWMPPECGDRDAQTWRGCDGEARAHRSGAVIFASADLPMAYAQISPRGWNFSKFHRPAD